MSEKYRTWSFCDPENPEEWFKLFRDVSRVTEPKHAAKGIITHFRLIPYLKVGWKVEED